jgi:hypothetical protein
VNPVVWIVGDGASAVEQRAPRIARRQVPASLVIRLLFGDQLAVGWGLVAATMAVIVAMLPSIELIAPAYDRQANVASIRIEDVLEREGDYKIYRLDYQFFDEHEVARRGVSYTAPDRPNDPTGYRVDYQSRDPSTSCLQGMRRRETSAGELLVAFAFAPVGLLVLALTLPRSLRMLRLLRRGVEVDGTLVRWRDELGDDGSVSKVAMTFEYDAGGARYSTTVERPPSGPLAQGDRRTVLYDPWSPALATTLEVIPGSPRIAAGGKIEAARGVAGPVSLSLLLLLGAAIVAQLSYAVVQAAA